MALERRIASEFGPVQDSYPCHPPDTYPPVFPTLPALFLAPHCWPHSPALALHLLSKVREFPPFVFVLVEVPGNRTQGLTQMSPSIHELLQGFANRHFRFTGTSAGLSSAQLSDPLTGSAWTTMSRNSPGLCLSAFPLSIRNALSGFLTSPLSPRVVTSHTEEKLS